MKKLWNVVNSNLPEDMTTGVFLTINILCWTLGTLALGILFCIAAGQMEIMSYILNIMCAAVYAGVIFGLFGGILFLMRRN